MSALQVPPAIAKIAPDGNLTPRQLRRFMIDMVLRRGKPGTGSSHEFMRRRTADQQWPDLRPVLQGFEWAIIGGVATRAYMPERVTHDLDILVHERDGEAVVKRIQEAGYHVVSPLAVPGYRMLSPDGIKVDVIFGKYPWTAEALAHPASDPAGYPVVKLSYLVVLKMTPRRIFEMGDLGTLLGWASDEDLDEVRKVFHKYAPEDLEDLESFIFIGKKEQEIPPPEVDEER